MLLLSRLLQATLAAAAAVVQMIQLDSSHIALFRRHVD
jgi:hypothetical protein